MKVIKLLPGISLSVLIALAACFIESILPVHVIGAAVIAIFIGMFVNYFLGRTDIFSPGLKFTSKKVLKFAIILLGLSLNIRTILQVGKMSLTVMVFTLLTCFGGGYFIGKALGLNWKLSNLISAGTGICGGSAIAAIQMLKNRGVKNIRFMCIIAAPEGVKKLQEAHPDVEVYIGALDEKLNEHGYIVPGLGDAGDRIFGTK